jgi:transcription initiation factor TFIIE subunit alpha
MTGNKKEAELDPVLIKVLTDFGGEDAIKLAKVLNNINDEEITDEKLADLSKVKLNVVRKILYILNENKLTSFRRVRDKRSGWFVYFWRPQFDALNDLLDERKKEVLEKLEARMHFEEDNLFFKCRSGCASRYKYIDAMDNNFACPVCHTGILDQDRKTEVVNYLKERIVHIRNQ